MRAFLGGTAALMACTLALPATATVKGIGVLFATEAQVARQCPRMAEEDAQPQMPAEIFTDGRPEARSAQLFAPVRQTGRPLALAASRCLAGRPESCDDFHRWSTQLAQSDALRFNADRLRLEPAAQVTGKLAGNLGLRPLALHLTLLRERKLVPPSPALDAWLRQRATDYRHMPRPLDARAAQNLVLHSALTGLTVGIATGQARPALDEAAAVFRLYIDTMRADGSLPQETRRGASSLKYDSMALGDLLLMGLLAHTQGLPLLEYRGPHGDLHQAVSFLAAALDDERLIAPYAAENFAPTDSGSPARQARAFLSANPSWFVLYARSFPRQAAGGTLLRHFQSNGPAQRTAFPFDENLGLASACVLRTGGA